MTDTVAIGYSYDRYNVRNEGPALAVARTEGDSVRIVSCTKFSKHESLMKDTVPTLYGLCHVYNPEYVLLGVGSDEMFYENFHQMAPESLRPRIAPINFADRILVDGERWNTHDAVNAHLSTLLKEDRLLFEGRGLLFRDKEDPLEEGDLSTAEAVGLACFGIHLAQKRTPSNGPYGPFDPKG